MAMLGVVMTATCDMLLAFVKGLAVAIPAMAAVGYGIFRDVCFMLGAVLVTTCHMLLYVVKGLTVAIPALVNGLLLLGIPALFKGLVLLGQAAMVQVVVELVVQATGHDDVGGAASPLGVLVLLGQATAPVVQAVGEAVGEVVSASQIATEYPVLGDALSATWKGLTMAISRLVGTVKTPLTVKAPLTVKTPLMWEAGQEGCVEVAKDSPEWDHISKYLEASLFNGNRPWIQVKYLNIERVQSKSHWQIYAAKREEVKHRLVQYPRELVNNKGCPEEKWLFHGTILAAVPHIVKRGFNRSFAGQNGTAHGKGAYFARDASDACCPQFAVPDKSGIQRIFMCRMVVGDWCQGSLGQLTPNSKPGGGLYDSTVDNLANPKFFVACHDAQVYPEYLVSVQLYS